MRQLLLIASSLILASQAFAETTVVRAAHYVDVDLGQLRSPAVIVVEDGIITSVNPDQVPDDVTNTIDLGGATLMPGLIDMHTHLTGDHDQHGYRRLAISIPRRAITGVKNARKTLLAGFTTVRDVGAAGFTDTALRDAINEGDVSGPRMFVSGPAIGITGGHCSDNNLLPPEYNASGDGVADGPWAARKAVRRNVKYGVDLIKTCSTGGVLSKGTKVGAPQYTLEELTALVEEAHSHGRKVASHAHGTEGIKNAILAGVDTVEHCSFLDDEAIQMAIDRGTYLSIDIYNTEFILSEGEKAGILPESLDKERVVGGRQRESFRRAVEAGAKVVLGSDAGVYPHGNNANQLSRMVRFGMTEAQTLKAATMLPAEALGHGDTIGQIKEGYFADMVAVQGNPLDDVSLLENIDFVMKEGKVYKQ